MQADNRSWSQKISDGWYSGYSLEERQASFSPYAKFAILILLAGLSYGMYLWSFEGAARARDIQKIVDHLGEIGVGMGCFMTGILIGEMVHGEKWAYLRGSHSLEKTWTELTLLQLDKLFFIALPLCVGTMIGVVGCFALDGKAEAWDGMVEFIEKDWQMLVITTGVLVLGRLLAACQNNYREKKITERQQGEEFECSIQAKREAQQKVKKYIKE